MTNFSFSIPRPWLALLVVLALVFGGSPHLWAQREATILDHQDRIRVTPLTILNSDYRETNLSITPDGQYLYFMSLRGGQRWSQTYMVFQGDSVYDGDIWYAEKENGQWNRPQPMPYGINSASGEDEPNVLGKGDVVYYQSWNYFWERTGGPYYRAERVGKSWSRPEGLGGGIAEFFKRVPATDGMSVSPDEKRFFVAAGYNYDGRMDIYFSRKTNFGWTYCRKLPISTSGNDRSIFLAADGKTLYFASDGYEGLGGLDIFKVTMIDDSTFGEVINIGAPFNTPRDDYGFILTGDGNEAYFVRDGDIYFADLKEADERIKPEDVQIAAYLEGTVRDSISWRGLPAEIILLDAFSKRVVARTQTDNGKYKIELPNEKRVYDEIVVSEGYPKRRQRIYIEKNPFEETYAGNFLLPPPAAEPPIAVIAAGDPLESGTRPEPSRPAAPLGENEPGTEAPPSELSGLQGVAQNPVPSQNTGVAQPPLVEAEPPEDPYSFDGVAENNLILLLDVSASMRKPEKLPLLKDAFTRLLRHMRSTDLISVVAYSGDARVVLSGISAAQSETIVSAIEELRSGGSTKGKSALKKAYRIAEENFISSGNNRIILATDGFFEVPELYSVAQRNAQRDISLSVFSFGKLPDSKIDELGRLARFGDGNYEAITPENVDFALLKEVKAVRLGGP